MKNILLICNAGMSTSLLVTKMKEAATKEAVDVNIWAVGNVQAKTEINKADIICLGPQVRYLEKRMIEMVENKIPVMIIDIQAYGQMNGAKVLHDALSKLSN